MSTQSHFSGRRQFLLASTALGFGLVNAPVRGDDGPVALNAAGRPDLYRVRIEMKVEGNVLVPENPLISKKEKLKLPIKSDAVFDYEERLRLPAGADANSIVTAIERYYHEAQSLSRLNRTDQDVKLRDAVRSTVVRRDTLPEVVYGVDDYFTHEELGLLRIPVCSVAVDRLLPVDAVAIGVKYMPDREALVSLLNLSSIEASDIEAEIVSIEDTEAKIEFRGKVDGSVEGVPTVIHATGKLTFDRTQRTCTWLAIALHETREIGTGEPGFDVAATIKMARKPIESTIALPKTAPPLAITAPIPADRLYVELQSKELGVAVLMERRWRMISDVPGSAVMRMIDNDQAIAQCDMRPLVKLNEGDQWTLDAFQASAKRTLGDQLTELLSADEMLSDSGLRVLRVVAQGMVQSVPIRWVMLHFSDDSGHRVSATFTMDGKSVETFAGSDEQLLNSLRLFDPLAEQKDAEVAARRNHSILRRPQDSKRISKVEPVSSASDIR